MIIAPANHGKGVKVNFLPTAMKPPTRRASKLKPRVEGREICESTLFFACWCARALVSVERATVCTVEMIIDIVSDPGWGNANG